MGIKLLISVLVGLIWLISSALINVVQAILFVFLKPVNPHLYRSINYYLTYSSWSQIVVLAEYITGSQVRVFYADEETRQHFGKEHSICISNHKYELDWLFCWMFVDKLKCLGNAKGMAKKSLKFMPIMGWCWYFCEFIFLERNWAKDKLIFGSSLDTFMEYVNPVLILLFCEGTRFTAEKYAASVAFAKERGIHYFKYHLVPRTRGFVTSIQHLKNRGDGKLKAVYNIQLAFDPVVNNDVDPTFVSMLNGHKLVGDLYIKRIAFDAIDKSSDKAIETFLNDMYKKKDELMEYHEENGTFAGTPTIFSRRKTPLINWLCWTSLITFAFFYTISHLYQNGNYISLAIIGLVLMGSVQALKSLVKATRAHRGSAYGGSPANSPKHKPKINTHQEQSNEAKQLNGNGTANGSASKKDN